MAQQVHIDAANHILNAVGGKDNIITVQHCMTRLRFELKDNSKFKEEKVKENDLVKGVNISAGQHQLIIGVGVVNKVYKEFANIIGDINNTDDSDVNIAGGNLLQKISRLFGDIFIPILPAIVATGLFLGLRDFAINVEIYETGTSWDTLFLILTYTVFQFLPAFVGLTAMKKFGGTPVIGLLIGLMLVSPFLPGAGAVGKGNAEALLVNFAGFSYHVTNFQSAVLPAVIIAYIAANIEKFLNKKVPDILNLFVVPFLTIGLSFFIALFVVGPITSTIENAFVTFYINILNAPLGIGGFIIGGLQQVLVISGMHHALWVIDINLVEQGANVMQGIRNASVLGQGGAVAAFIWFAVKKEDRSIAIPATLSSTLGITEPAIFGLTLPYRVPFLYGCLGSALGGMTAVVFKVAPPAMGVAGITGFLVQTPDTLMGYIFVTIVSFGVPFVLTAMWAKKEKSKLK